ncbi:MAG: hypothetical protein ACKOS8_15960 [Gemmataceae bacterium]
MTYSLNDKDLNQNAEQVFLRSTGGFVSIDSLGDGAIAVINSNAINLNGDGAFVQMQGTSNGGGISLSAQGDGGCIQLNTPGGGTGTFLALTPNGFILSYGPPTAMGTVQVQEGEMALSMGPPGLGSLLTLTPDSITLKVGLATLTLTAEGLSTSVGSTTVEVGPSGVSESAGPNSRELGPSGHALVAGETSLEVGMAGLDVSGPSGALAFDASGQISSALGTESADGMLNLQGPMVNVGS